MYQNNKNKPVLAAIAYSGIVVGAFVVAADELFHGKTIGSFSVTSWLVVIGMVALMEIRTGKAGVDWISSPSTRLSDWTISLIIGFAALFVFATFYYPKIKASWGGGSPVPAVVYFSKDSRILPSQYLQTQLLDETDAGYYVLDKNQKAIFIPRNTVLLVYFSDKLPDATLVEFKAN